MKGEDQARARVGIAFAAEKGFDAGGFVKERQLAGQSRRQGDRIDERAQQGLFLAFQYPQAIPGVRVTDFLRTAINAIRRAKAGGVDNPIPVREFRDELFPSVRSYVVVEPQTVMIAFPSRDGAFMFDLPAAP